LICYQIDSILSRLSFAGSSGVLLELLLISMGIPEELPKDYGRNMAGMQKKYIVAGWSK
jgi:hypothetical protein